MKHDIEDIVQQARKRAESCRRDPASFLSNLLYRQSVLIGCPSDHDFGALSEEKFANILELYHDLLVYTIFAAERLGEFH